MGSRSIRVLSISTNKRQGGPRKDHSEVGSPPNELLSPESRLLLIRSPSPPPGPEVDPLPWDEEEFEANKLLASMIKPSLRRSGPNVEPPPWDQDELIRSKSRTREKPPTPRKSIPRVAAAPWEHEDASSPSTRNKKHSIECHDSIRQPPPWEDEIFVSSTPSRVPSSSILAKRPSASSNTRIDLTNNLEYDEDDDDNEISFVGSSHTPKVDSMAPVSSTKTTDFRASLNHQPATSGLSLPPPVTTLWEEKVTGPPPATVKDFQSAASSSLSMMKNIGIPEPATTQPGRPYRASGVGQKRLGMGMRDLPQWTSKRSKPGSK